MITKAKTPPHSIHPLEEAAECLKTLGHPVRLRMIDLLLKRSYSVGELAKACFIPSHMASEHLRLMKMCGFLDHHREGRKTYYYVIEPHLEELMKCVRSRFRIHAEDETHKTGESGGSHEQEGRHRM